ncbi:Pls/PosA family non-ribosomal peptide synthetase [Amycolatopsis mediterranei]|uniref:Amino acid adenylation domain-containing protein n=2 Tax=Amycolatopsis mediterranei TaxID=33910 RepID=A0A0H3DBY0_AMYMU|nr:Pls/PosA family non-ribosomal peptide synthetase [Amycolatopsis mediterranei]ADJ47737.1 amino acid adenylation domain-containing protein [Amycolatopsis mediterranei U32]KDO11791.1 amino acid adenylation protein [Amycolatopsis mediterranei]KDU84930.1 amino acid adenylation protein [Amycolatopsis mediterranei]UZF72753.1 amino acid adenylation domain-containing protein [Amycolatopsis mediterranei]
MTVTIEPTGSAAAVTAEVTPAPVADRALFWSGLGAGERTLLDVLAATAERHPNAAAIDDGVTTLTYRRLLEEIDAYGRRLQGYGVGLGDRVGIRISSGTAELYIAILATLSVGAAYVPVDADDPDERAELVFEEAQVAAVATDGKINVHSTPGGREGTPGPADDAWIIFTSGSTGKPKGVAVTHASAAAFVDAEAELFLTEEPIGPGDRVLAGLSVAFDASCEEMWLAWRHGACLVPAPRALVRTGVDLGPWLVAQRITVVSTVPTLAALWPADALEDVRLLIFGGEACPPELAERVAVEGREVWNTYGPTEATVVACAAQLTGDGPVRIGLPLVGWQLAVVNEEGVPVAMGETGELVIGGVGLARYLDAAKDAEKFAPLPSLGWQRAYRSGDMVRAEEEGLLFLGRLDEQVKLGGRRIELGEVDAALQALPGVQGAAAAVRRTKAGNQVLVGYVVPGTEPFDLDQAATRLREHLPAALVPLLAVVEDLPTRTSGKVDRNALPWPLSTVEASGLTPTETWVAEGWAEILGVSVDSPKADFFTHGGGSLTAAQVVARIRTRHPQVSVADIYAHPKLGALAAMLDALSGQATERRDIAPTKRRAGVIQTALMVPLTGLVGLRWATLAAALSNILSLLGFAWAPTLSWAWIGLAWVVLFSPAGRIAIAAGGARVLLSGVRPGTYPRGGSVHLRLWTAEKLAEFSGADSVAGASWMTTYAKALGARIGKDVDLHSPPPVTGFLKLGRGAAIEPEVDLTGHWVDGDVVHIGKVHVGADARIGARSTLFPGVRVGKGAEIAAGSTVRGAVPAGQRWAGSPAARVAKDERDALKWPSSRPPRSHFWAAVYGVTSLALGFLPGVAGLAGVAVLGYGIAGAPTLLDAFTRALVFVPAATAAYFLAYMLLVLVGVRSLSIGMVEGYHPVHGRVAWQVWATERLMSMAREGLFPLYASLFTPVWLRLLGAKVGRNVEASTVLALPKMTKVDSGAFLADDTMVATYELNHGWLHVAPARIGKQAFLGNSGMTAPGRSVPKRGLVGVLSSTPLKAKKGSSYLGMPPLPVRRAIGDTDTSRTYTPALHLKAARALVELCRIVPVMCGVALTVVVAFGLLWTASAFGFGVAALLAGPALLAAGVVAALTATVMKWLLVGKFREVDHPLWSSFVWRNELADTFVEALAVPWLIGSVGGTPLLTAWLRTMGVKIGRGVWLETYWLPEADLVSLGDGATINRGCVVQTHLFHDRIMSMSSVTLGEGATLGPHGIVLPGAGIGARTTVGPGSLVTRGDEVPADTRWLGNPISTWPGK